MGPARLYVYGNLTATDVVRLFTSSLSDPHNPQHCAMCLYGCLVALQHGEESHRNIEILRREFHDLYDTCMNFLTVARTEDEIAQLKETVVICMCDLNDPVVKEVHRVADVSRSSSKGWDLSCVAEVLMSTVYYALQPAKAAGNVHKVAKNAQKAALTPDATVPWPTKPQDVVPHGAETSIRSIAEWMEISPVPITLGFVGSILEICKKQVIPHFVSSTTLPGKFVGITEIVWKIWTSLKLQRPRTAQIKPANCLADLKRAALISHMLVNLCSKQELIEFAHNAEKQHGSVVDLCTRILEWLPELDASIQPRSSYTDGDAGQAIEYSRISFRALGSNIHQALGLPFNTTKYHPSIALHSVLLATGETPIAVTFKAYHHLYHHQRCFAPGCLETYSSAGRKFAMCAGCGRVPYCSKECQTRAWKHSVVPHKAVCKKFRMVAEKTGLPACPEVGNAEAFSKAALKLDPALPEEIALHWESLQNLTPTASCETAQPEAAVPTHNETVDHALTSQVGSGPLVSAVGA